MGLLSNVLAIVKSKKAQVPRSSQWPKIRDEHLLKNPTCAICGEKTKLEVHHIMPFHDDPSKELDPNNLITLCEVATHGVICHLFFGHLGNYKSFNKDVLKDAEIWNDKIKNRPE